MSAALRKRGNKNASAQWTWENPFLRSDGTVWVYAAYGDWAIREQDDQIAEHWAHRYATETDLRPNSKRGRTLYQIHEAMLVVWLEVKAREWELEHNPQMRTESVA